MKSYSKMFDKKRKLARLRRHYVKNPSFGSNLSQSRRYTRSLKRPRNPIFKKLKKISLLLASLAGIIFFLYLITFSNYFLLKNFNFKDNPEEQNTFLNEQITIALKDQLGKNLLFLDTENLQEKIQEKYPEIQQISIKKNYPDKVDITLETYPLTANIISETPNLKKSYIINQIGFIINEDMENTGLPYIHIKSDEPINNQNAVIEANKLKYILDSYAYFQDKFGMGIAKIEYKPIAREVHLLTEKNFYIWLDIQLPFEEQLKKLKKTLVKLDIHNEPLQYIDLRIAGGNGDKIIYKRK